jgi:hypothetical protein
MERLLRTAAVLALLAAAASCRREGDAEDPFFGVPRGAAPGPAQKGSPGQASVPDWTRLPPHLVVREGRLQAVAVGQAHAGNVSLARAVAEERARADLLRFLQGRAAEAEVKGLIAGAKVSNAFTSRRGRVYVELGVQADEAP